MLFQFHKGAIGVRKSCKRILFLRIFQFHKGAIGVQTPQKELCQKNIFQFHKGAIGVLILLLLLPSGLLISIP